MKFKNFKLTPKFMKNISQKIDYFLEFNHYYFNYKIILCHIFPNFGGHFLILQRIS